MIDTADDFDTAVTKTLETVLRQSSSLEKLFAALSKAQSQMAGAVRDAENPHFKHKYADLASCWDACRKPLTENSLTVLQPVKADGPSVTVTTILAHASGQWMSESLTMTAGANTPQAIGSAITYGRRYGLCAMVGIAPDDDDGHAASQQAPTTERVEKEKGVWMPAGLDGSDLPLGVVYIRHVAPGMGQVPAFIEHTGQAVNEGGLPIFKQMAQAEQWCAAGQAVKLTLQTSKKSGKAYVAQINPVEVGFDEHGDPMIVDLPF